MIATIVHVWDSGYCSVPTGSNHCSLWGRNRREILSKPNSTLLDYTAIHQTALHCNVLDHIEQHFTVLFALHIAALNDFALHHTELNCYVLIALTFTAQHYTVLHYTALCHNER